MASVVVPRLPRRDASEGGGNTGVKLAANLWISV